MNIVGMQKTTLLDYPGKVASTIFFGGCNFRCPFCHNASVVYGNAGRISDGEVLSFLEKRKGILDGVCITGGEPLLQKELPFFLEQIKEKGLSVKLDTNGSSPKKMKELVGAGLVDFVAMDIKNSPQKYAITAGVKVIDLSDIFESADYLMSGEIDFEFRTTVVKNFHEKSDFEAIGSWLRGDEKYYLQSFKDSGDIISEGMSAVTKEELSDFLAALKKNIPNAEIRGE